MSREEEELLDAATSPTDAEVDAEGAGLREGWQAFGRLAEASASESPAIDPHEIAYAVRRRLSLRRSGFWSAPAWKVAAALLLGSLAGTAAWKLTRQPVVAVEGGSAQPANRDSASFARREVGPKGLSDEPWNDDWQAVAAFVYWALVNFPASDRQTPDEFQLVRADLNRFEAECSLESL